MLKRIKITVLVVFLISISGALTADQLSKGQRAIEKRMAELQEDWLSLSYVKSDDNPVNDRGQTDKQSKPGFVCTETIVNLEDNVGKVPLFSNPPDNVFPGSIIMGSTVGPGSYGVFSGLRNGGDIVFSAPWSDAHEPESKMLGSKRVEVLDLKAYTDTLGKFVNENREMTAAISYTVERVFSNDHLSFLLSAKVTGSNFDVKGSLSVDEKSNNEHVLIKVDQVYFRASLNRPSYGSQLFSPKMTSREARTIADQITGTNPPVYVSSMDYGRTLYALFSAAQSDLDLKASLEAGYRGGINVDGSMNAEYESHLQKTSAKGYILGGSATGAANTVADLMPTDSAGTGLQAVEAIRTWVKEGANSSFENPPVPMGYQLAMLSDGRKTHSRQATEFTESNCKVGVCPSGPIWARKEGTTWVEISPSIDPQYTPAAGKIGAVIKLSNGNFYTYEWGRCINLNWTDVELTCIENQAQDFKPGVDPPGIWSFKDGKPNVWLDGGCVDHNNVRPHVQARRIKQEEVPYQLEVDTPATGTDPHRAYGLLAEPEKYRHWR